MELMPNKVFRERQVIFREGEHPNWVYYICSGRVEVSKRQEKGRSTRILEPGDVFGELALIGDIPRDTTIIALEDTWVYHFSPESYAKKLHEMDYFMHRVFMSLVSSLQKHSLISEEKAEVAPRRRFTT